MPMLSRLNLSRISPLLVLVEPPCLDELIDATCLQQALKRLSRIGLRPCAEKSEVKVTLEAMSSPLMPVAYKYDLWFISEDLCVAL